MAGGRRGWIALPRDIADHVPGWAHLVTRAVIVQLALDAAWEPRPAMIAGQMVELQRGEVAYGRDHLAQAIGATGKQVRGVLARLEERGVISARRASRFTIRRLEIYDLFSPAIGSDGPAEVQKIGQKSGQKNGQKSGQVARPKNTNGAASLGQPVLFDGPEVGPEDRPEDRPEVGPPKRTSPKKSNKRDTSPTPDGAGDLDVYERMAERLRTKILEEQPRHRLRLATYWTPALRSKWAKVCRLMIERDQRDLHEARDVLNWVFGDQGGRDPTARFVVESPASWREKFDNIMRAMGRVAKGKPEPEATHKELSGV